MWIYFLPITSAMMFLYVFLHMCEYIYSEGGVVCTKKSQVHENIPINSFSPYPALLISLFFFASSNSAACAIADKLIVMNQRPCYRHVSCTGGANAVANIAATAASISRGRREQALIARSI